MNDGDRMDSIAIKDLRHATWHPFNMGVKKELMESVPHLPGVYVIRSKQHFSRLMGETDIAYIGRATVGKGNSRRKGLNRRINGYLHTTEHRRTSYRVMTWVEKLGDFEIAFIICNNNNEAIDMEISLLKDFEKEHAELPPFNRQGNKI